ncbi:hypothetical protein BHU72_12965 [Desulfuribacillus stibiiarsenatis]|uniref:Regulatory protein YycH domain-containing protein n=1 Tax=Desulfuribacillus stibiiarsenatis TaxID=1390249 RepID=A0A1E5L8N1_9FIRM|nr:two-component system activity regulator YycH [Desulfuribacillus stibiiarsenatis]OEH86517.1 hypothetical protein BHU72_12965 [Desulfuribacillus stibiiarsenatis]
MLERMKTVILTTLVITSLMLSAILSYVSPEYSPLVYTEEPSKNQDFNYVYVDETLIPREIRAFSGQEKNTIYPMSQDFNEIYQSIQKLTVTNIETTTVVDLTKHGKRVQLSFYKAVPYELLSHLLDIEVSDIRKIEGNIVRATLYIDAKTDQLKCLLEGDRNYLASIHGNKGQLNEVIQQIINITKVEMLPLVEIELLSIQPREYSNLLFEDLTQVRQILEKDKSIIYTDGNRGLRVNIDSNTMEYTDPSAEDDFQQLSTKDMLLESVYFLNEYQSWAGEYIIANIDAISKSRNEYSLVFQQLYYGLPIISPNILPLSELQFKMQNNRVNRFLRSTKYLGAEMDSKMVSILPSEYMAAIINRQFSRPEDKWDYFLAYYPEQITAQKVQMRPVWVVVNKQSVSAAYDARNGQEIHQIGGWAYGSR